MVLWEYKSFEANVCLGSDVESVLRRMLDAMGKLGWELVSVCGVGSTSERHRFYFKRQMGIM